jgi:hypothetical protein
VKEKMWKKKRIDIGGGVECVVCFTWKHNDFRDGTGNLVQIYSVLVIVCGGIASVSHCVG